jgi:hypothetical protein
MMRKSNVGAGENNWSLVGSSVITHWAVLEVAGLDTVAPLDVEIPTGGTNPTSSGTTVSPGTTAQGASYDVLEIAVFGSYRATNVTPNAFSAYTNDYTELYQGGFDNGTKSIGLAIAAKTSQQLAAKTVSATTAVTLTATDTAASYLAVYSAEGAKQDANITHFWGMRVGAAAAGLAIGTAGARYFETVVGSPAMTADGLQCSAAAAAESVATANIVTTTQIVKAAVARVEFRLDSVSADLELAYLKPASNPTDLVTLRYVSASQKLGVKVGSGSEVLSDAVVTAGVFIGVDLRFIGTTTAYSCEWQIDYDTSDATASVDQAQATATGSIALGQWIGQLGWTAASTGTVTYAYAAYSIRAGHYPLGRYVPVLLKPDPAGTITISGTSTNFGVMTGNATIAAWNAANALAAIDDWPPVVGGSADGAGPILAHATDYMEVPLETYDLSGTARIHAARPVLPMWAASGTAATVRVLGFDGTTATTLFSEANPTTDNSSTPGWVCAMWRPTGGWDQGKLDAAAIRVGSNDATPDIMPHAVGMEILVKPGDTAPLFGDLASATSDPTSAGILGVSVTPTGGYDASLHYEEGGSPTDVATPGGMTTTEVIDAPDAPAVNYVALYPPAEDISDA